MVGFAVLERLEREIERRRAKEGESRKKEVLSSRQLFDQETLLKTIISSFEVGYFSSNFMNFEAV